MDVKAKVLQKGDKRSADLLRSTFFAKYKNRFPDPGECRIISVDWQEQRLEMANGACRYFPKFDEVEMISQND